MPICNAAKYDALNYLAGSGDVIKMAFFTGAQGATTAAYSATGEVTEGTNIPAGGITLATRAITAGDGSVSTATLDYANPTITPGAQVQFRYNLIYNSSRSNRAIAYIDHGSTQTLNASTPYTIDIGSGSVLVSLA